VDSPNSFPEYIEYVVYEFTAPGAGTEYCGWLQGSLDDTKKRKVKEYWLSLPVPFRQGILESLKEERSLEPSASVRQLQTTKNDRCRLLHLRADTRLSAFWRRALSP